MASGQESSRSVAGPTLGRKIVRALFTKEDTFNFHKTLGISCLLSYMYRFAHVGPSDMLFSASKYTLGTILLHTCLSVSSLIFKIPMKRIATGYRIWPEYRLHSIAFALRSLACMLVVWAEKRFGIAAPHYEANVAIVLATIALADFGTWWVGPQGRSSTIQDLDAPPAMRFFFSVMQFHATAGCLVGIRRFSTQFFYVWIIQFTAFLMTLRRKNLAPHWPLVFGYGIMLAAGFCISTYDHLTAGSWLLVQTLANSAAVIRLYGRVNKYIMWAGLGAGLYVLRPHLVVPESDPNLNLKVGGWLLSTSAIVLVGIRKVQRDYKVAVKSA